MNELLGHRAAEHVIGRQPDHRRAADAARRLLASRRRSAKDIRLLIKACDDWLAPIEQGRSAPVAPATGVEGFNALSRLRDALRDMDTDALPDALRDALPVFNTRTPARSPVWEPAAVAMWLAGCHLLDGMGQHAGTSSNSRAVRLAAAATRRLGFPGITPKALSLRLSKKSRKTAAPSGGAIEV
jgi:hypothetical protein